jgi:hypothetical protein
VRRSIRAAIYVAVVTAGGCVKGFQGANIEIDLSPGNPLQVLPGVMPAPGELPSPTHFTLYAIQQTDTQDHLFEIARFEVHHIVQTGSPCFIDVGDHVPHPGLHVTSYVKKIQEDTGVIDPANAPGATDQDKQLVATALQRQTNIALLTQKIDLMTGMGGPLAVTSASPGGYPMVAMDCNGPDDQVPPPQCIDDASNQRRLAVCQKAWKDNPALWEGTDRVLTAPLNGETHGMVLLRGTPITGAPVGGAQFFVDNALDDVDAFGIYIQPDTPDGVDAPGTQLYFGRPTMPTRGVRHVHMVSPVNPALTAELAVFADLGEDDVHF